MIKQAIYKGLSIGLDHSGKLFILATLFTTIFGITENKKCLDIILGSITFMILSMICFIGSDKMKIKYHKN